MNFKYAKIIRGNFVAFVIIKLINSCFKHLVNCTCIIDKRKNYDESGKLNFNFEQDKKWLEKIYPINECSLECDCDETRCFNRVVQHGCKFKLQTFDCDGPKGNFS